MAGFEAPWGICGGWALDLFAGKQTRQHGDVDVAVFRRDQAALYRYLADRGWWLEIADNGKLSVWEADQPIDPPLHSIWASNQRFDPTFVEFLLNERDGTNFIFRRDPSVRFPVEQAFVTTASGIPVLTPDIVNLYLSTDKRP
jgi:aminoglycoside-2''-adenylyltransferase